MDLTRGPLYKQIVHQISAQIQSEDYRAGDKLPSERALCDEFGVSQITVRRALRELSHAGRVYSRHGLGWYVSQAAASQAHPDVALVVGDTDSLLNAILPACLQALSRAGITSMVLPGGDGDNGAQETLGMLEGLAPQAVLWGVAGPEEELSKRYQTLVQATDLPGLLLLRQVEGLELPAIVLDEGQGIARTTAHLIARGHRRLAYIGGDPSLAEGWQRYWGFATTIWEAGLDLPLDWILAVPRQEPIAEKWLEQVFGGSQGPTGIVCATEALAAEAMQRLQKLGYTCPDQVAIAGMGDDPLAAYLAPSLTTFGLDAQGWAQAVAKATRALLAGQEPKGAVFSGQLIVRDSCGARSA
jgi:GntR family transcriptional regulator, arabinose operon transcriptional repressor